VEKSLHLYLYLSSLRNLDYMYGSHCTALLPLVLELPKAVPRAVLCRDPRTAGRDAISITLAQGSTMLS